MGSHERTGACDASQIFQSFPQLGFQRSVFLQRQPVIREGGFTQEVTPW